MFGYGGWLYIQGDVGLGTLVAFTGYLSNFFDPVQQLSQLYNTFLAASAALDKIFDVMDVEPKLVDAPDAIDIDIDGVVDFDDVHFGYRADREVLHGLDLHAAAGETVALVGPTGAGKSTIVKLLAALLRPDRGRDPHRRPRPARRASRRRSRARSASCRRRASCSTAPSARTSPTAAPTPPTRDIAGGRRPVGAHDFIRRLPHGYDTPVQRARRRCRSASGSSSRSPARSSRARAS